MGGPGAMPPGAADQFKNMSADDLKRASEELKDMDPETLKSTMNAAQSQMQGQQDYVMRGAEQLKRDGNKLVGEEKFTDAIEKYMRVKNNLQDIQTPAARALRTSCMLNMSLCFNKTKRYNSAVSECTEVLLGDGRSLKAYYRRGQAHYAKGELARAVKDLRRAVKLAPGDETVAAECAKAESDMKEKGVVDEDDGACPAFEGPDPSSAPPATANPGGSGSFPGMPPGTSQAQMDQAMKMMKDPAAMSKAAEMMENMSEEQLEEMQKMAGASMPGAPKLDPGMAKQARGDDEKHGPGGDERDDGDGGEDARGRGHARRGAVVGPGRSAHPGDDGGHDGTDEGPEDARGDELDDEEHHPGSAQGDDESERDQHDGRASGADREDDAEHLAGDDGSHDESREFLPRDVRSASGGRIRRVLYTGPHTTAFAL